MRPFEYLAPKNLDEALSLLSKHKDEAKVLAGGQSLVNLLRQRLIAPAYVIDIKQLPELAYIRENKGDLKVGALTTHRELETSPVVAKRFPILVEAENRLANRQIRNWGTVGGNLIYADPGGDLAPSLMVLGAKVKMVRASGEREVPVTELFTDYLSTVLAPDEILTEITIPYFKARMGGAYHKEAIRAGDHPIAAVAVVVALGAKGDTIKRAMIAMGGVGMTPLRAPGAEQLLAGKKISADIILKAGEMAATECHPTTDVEGSEEYKRLIVRLLTRDMLNLAIKRAQAG